MGRVVWQGKERHHVSVGKGGMYDFTNPQSAWDSITDSAEGNPYLITLEPGIYEQDSPAEDEPAWWFFGKTDISITGSRAAVLRKTGTTGGGSVAVGKAGAMAERVRLDGFTIANPLTGGVLEGSPPEGGLYIGQEHGNNDFDTAMNYDQVEVCNMHILGVHDALQLFGTVPPTDGGPAIPGRVWIRNNLIQSVHDAYTVKGEMRLDSLANQIYVHSAGDHPYLTNIGGWKHTGIHYNTQFDVLAATARGGSQYSHVAEQINVIGNGNNGGGIGGTNLQQKTCAGIYVYTGGATPGGVMYPGLHFTGCSIRLSNLFDADLIRGFAGILVLGKHQIDDWDFVFENGSIDVYQESTGTSAPANAAGVKLADSDAGTQYLRIINSRIRVRNVQGTAPLAYSMQTEHANHYIKHTNVIDEAADGIDDAVGNIDYTPPRGAPSIVP